MITTKRRYCGGPASWICELVVGVGLAGLAGLLVTMTAGVSANAQSIESPDWAAIFDADGNPLDELDAAGDPYPDGVYDFVDLYNADDAVTVLDNLSDGVAIDMSVLLDEQTVANGVLSAPKDIGNTYVLARRDGAGNRVIEAGIERFATKSGGWIDLYLLQDKVQVKQGAPWPIHGETQDGDLAVRLKLKGGRVSDIDAAVWHDGAFDDLGGVKVAQSCGGQVGVLSACSGPPPIEGSQSELRDADGNPVDLQADDFIDVTINVGVLSGSNPDFTSIQVRTSDDISLGSFVAIGAWAEASN